MEDLQLLKYLEHFSLLTVGNNKVPNFPWKQLQSEKLDNEEFLKRYRYKGGIIRNDGSELPATEAFGIITGYDFLEVLDIDLKVFSTAQEQVEFWEEYIETLRDNILDFDEKFALYKTKNSGYHILYKTKRVGGNIKVASLKGHKEAVIETRGIGGYVFAYPENKISKKSYFDIDFISDKDRETLFFFSEMHNHVEAPKEAPEKKFKEYKSTNGIYPSTDFNNKTDIFTVIGDDFIIPPKGNKSKKIVVKRHGATSPHSGYVFKDSGGLYLHSTGTIYPHRKLLSPYDAYAWKYHGGDFKKASKDLYAQGFGTRVADLVFEKKIPNNTEKIEEYLYNKDDLTFPIDIFPDGIQHYMLECATKLDSDIDYMGCSLLWLISLSIGNAIEVEVKRGWKENVSLWLSLVGKAGHGKTPSINNIIFPLKKVNHREIKNYYDNLEKFEYYDRLTKKEKESHQEVEKPIKRQFIANDITLEALVDLHQESDNAVGVFKDELAGWLKDMNKYRAGSDLEFWLSTWSGESVSLNRLTRKGSFIQKPFIPVLGGIQPSVLNSFYTEENKENGFLDRMLLSFPDNEIEYYNDNELEYSVLDTYSDYIILFFESIKSKINRDKDGQITPMTARFTDEAKKEWKRIFNEISDFQNSDDENEYLKSMYPKQKSYIPRFSLILHVFNDFFNREGNTLSISKESVLKAEKLSKYFVATAKKVKINSIEINNLKEKAKTGGTTFEKVQKIYEEDPDFNRTKVADLLGVSRKTITRMVQRIKDEDM